jgi:hypothetical protein
MRLSLTVYDQPGGTLLADWSNRAKNIKITTNRYGFKSLTALLPMSLAGSFYWYDRPGMPHVELNYGAQRVWEGRLEDIAFVGTGGIRITVLGYWRALSDLPYSALWSTTSVAGIKPVTPALISTREPARYEMDTNNRIYIAAKINETCGTSFIGSQYFAISNGSSRNITNISFDWEILAPSTSWELRVDSYTSAWASVATLQTTTVTTPAVVRTGSSSITLGTTAPTLVFSLVYNAAAAAFAGPTGTAYIKITNVRIKTTTSASVYADEIATALATFINATNSTQLQTVSQLIQSPALDLKDESYEDAYPADILARLVKLGDNQSPPRQWEVGVFENRILHFRPRGDTGRTWYVDSAAPDLNRTIDALRNSAYAVYKDASGVTVRGATSTDSGSISRYGITRSAAVKANTTSSTFATTQRDAYLQDRKDPIPQAGIVVDVLFDQYGAPWPAFLARSGDTVVIRNLPPTLSANIDRIRSMRIDETSFDVDSGKLTITPESSPPTLDVLVARRAENL